MERYDTMKFAFEEFRKVVSKFRLKSPGYPCRECIVNVCCSIECEEFKMWLRQSAVKLIKTNPV